MTRILAAIALTLTVLSFAAPAAHAGDGNETYDTRYGIYTGE